MFRAFYGIKGNLTRRDGTPTNALYGFCTMILNLLAKAGPGDSFAVAFDASRKNFRHEIYADYKANRTAMPDALAAQLSLSRAAVRAMGVECLEIEGFEADDIIATLAKRECGGDGHIRIVSGDKDLMQLISDCCTLYDGMKEQVITKAEATEKFGVPPERILDFQAIVGDSTDNIPGVPGLGPKAATKLLTEFDTLDGIYANIDQVLPDRARNLLIEYKNLAYISKQLAALSSDAPVPQDAGTHKWKPDLDAMTNFFQNELESPSLVSRAKKLFLNELSSQATGEVARPEISSESLEQFLPLIKDVLAIVIEHSGANYMTGRMTSITLATESASIKIPLGLSATSLFDSAPSADISALKPVLENPNIIKIASNWKFMLHIFQNSGFEALKIGPLADTSLMAYSLRFHAHEHENLINLYEDLKSRLNANSKLRHIYETCDAPLLKVLWKIERAGVALDREALAKLSARLHERLQATESEIYDLAGGDKINLASPQQLAQLLFTKLGIKNPKKNSTDASVLGAIIAEHAIIPKVLEWRRLAKLIGTYTDALPKSVAADGRIHTTFLQTSTNTGRLSSEKPNLQNIPVKGDEGANLRGCFVPAKGYKFVIADYSQIQLRLLADIAHVAGLKQIFASGKDIHSMTAHKIFGAPLDKITPAERRKAKTVNFSISYGVSAFGLAQQLDISNSEAQKLIDAYFEAFPEIKAYNENIAAFAKEHAYVETPMGRRVDLPEIRHPATRAYAIRAAVNAPIQGAEADLVRLATIKVDEVLENTGARLVLQVHDELVAEVPDDKAEEIADKIKTAMEHITKLSIPLTSGAIISNKLE